MSVSQQPTRRFVEKFAPCVCGVTVKRSLQSEPGDPCQARYRTELLRGRNAGGLPHCAGANTATGSWENYTWPPCGTFGEERRPRRRVTAERRSGRRAWSVPAEMLAPWDRTIRSFLVGVSQKAHTPVGRHTPNFLNKVRNLSVARPRA